MRWRPVGPPVTAASLPVSKELLPQPPFSPAAGLCAWQHYGRDWHACQAGSVTGEPAHVARASDPLAPLGHAPCVRPRLCVAPQCDAPTTAGSHSDSAGMKVTSIKTTNITP